MMTPGDLGINKTWNIHFVGIGGVGMSGIAEVMFNMGFKVSGSDLQQGEIVRRLQVQGIDIFIGHGAEHLGDAKVVVRSSAVADDNPELQAAREQRIPIIPRAEMLAELMRFRHGIAVAGTHGKTTTTSLVAAIFAKAGLDPTFIVGGRVNSCNSHASLGSGSILVAEADESDGSFLHLQPVVAVVTNIDADHMHHYGGDFQKLTDTFSEFLHNLPFYGRAVLCIDNQAVQTLAQDLPRPISTYGFHASADFRLADFKQQGTHIQFKLWRHQHEQALAISMNLPGVHNALNAAAAIAVAAHWSIADDIICQALQEFEGIERRFQVLGNISVGSTVATKSALLVDDYGHHPVEVSASIQTARTAWPKRRLLMVFQPHRYSRTHQLFDDFVNVLSEVDLLVLLEVYAAGEQVIVGADSRTLAQAIRQRGKINPILIVKWQSIKQVLDDLLQDKDVVLVQGAGSVGEVAKSLQVKSGLIEAIS